MKNNYRCAFLLFIFCYLNYHVSLAQASGEYTWKNVQIQGGGFVTGLIYNPSEKDLVYARRVGVGDV